MAKGTVDKWKSKKWIEIVAPKMFNSKPIGHTVATDPRKVVDRVIKVNMGDLTGDHNSRQRITLRFKIEKLVGDQANTKFLGFMIQKDQRRNVSRKKTAKVYVNQKIKTKDDKEFIVKSNIVISRSASKSARTAVDKKYREALIDESKGSRFSDFISDLLGNRISSKLKKELHNIYPVKHITIEKVEISENIELPDEPVARVRQRRDRNDQNRWEKTKKYEKTEEKEEKTGEKVEEKEEKEEKTPEKKEKKPEKEKKVKEKPEKKEEKVEKEEKKEEKSEKPSKEE